MDQGCGFKGYGSPIGLFYITFSRLFLRLVPGRFFMRFFVNFSAIWVPFGGLLSIFLGLWDFAGLHSLLHENILSEVLETPCQHLFVYFCRS